MKKQLYCTFLDDGISYDEIVSIYNPPKIFLFSNTNNTYLITFNSDIKIVLSNLNLFLINRFYKTNTLFTINGLNALILNLTGIIDPNFPINWEEYSNSIIYSKNGELIIDEIELIDVISFI